MAMARCFSFWWLVLPSRERNNFTVKLKTYNCTVFTDFQHTKLYPFQPWVYSYHILKILQISASIFL